MNELTKGTGFDELFSDADMMSLMMMIMMIAVMSSFMSGAVTTETAALTAQGLAAQSFEGQEDPREVRSTNILSWLNFIYDYPFRPWVSAYIINDGPSPVEIGINYPDDRFRMEVGETITVTRTGAEERIKIMYFICVPGLRANLRVTGAY